ncbi:OmpL47-type beta-barrel domain-containing protein [Candidatus Poribacteria bacterium]
MDHPSELQSHNALLIKHFICVKIRLSNEYNSIGKRLITYKGDEMKYVRIPFFIVLLFLLASNVQYPASSIEYLTYRFEVSKELTDHKGSVNSIVFSPDDSLIASGSEDSTVKLWEADSGERIKAIMRHPFPILSVAISPDSYVVAAGSEAGTITLWDVNYKERIKTLKGHTNRVESMRFSPDGSTLASGSANHTIRLWDMDSGKEVKQFSEHTDSVNSLAFSPDGKILASSSADGIVKLWNMESGESIFTLKESAGGVNSVCFNPDGAVLASGSANGVIRLWDVSSGEEIRWFESESKAAIGIDDGLAFSPDNRIMVSGSSDGKITVWDVSSGSMVQEFRAHTEIVKAVVFNSDGKRMASAGSNGVAKLWKIYVRESLEITLDAEYEGWQRGMIELKADIVGMPDVVKFQYSTDGSTWLDIVEKREPPYFMEWNTRESIPGVAKAVNLRAVAERVTGTTAIDMAVGSFSVDNQPPETQHTYDGLWHKEDFRIELSADDGSGIGVDVEAVGYKLNYGQEKNIMWDGQPEITEEGMNTLEYWSVDKMGNAEPYKVLSEVKLDRTAPAFLTWTKEPESLVEGATGPLRISVHVNDGAGSGLAGRTPQFDYHIGLDTAYDGYEDMSEAGDNAWYFDIPEPSEGWGHYGGQAIRYRAICEDVAGNVGQSAERQELIGSSKSPPTVKLTSAFQSWEKGPPTIEVDASDPDGTIENVQFEYSLDGVSWTSIGTDDAPPYSLKWDTRTVIPEVERTAWVRIIATDNDGFPAEYVTPQFGIDNQLPTTDHDYDGLWHKTNFTVNLSASDVGGSGVSSTKYRLNDGGEKDTSTDGQPLIDAQGKNALEYWSIDVAGNEEEHKLLSTVKLDRLSPLFDAWEVEQEGSVLHVKVEITDPDSSIKDAPQFAYRIGPGRGYSDYKEMQKIDEHGWKYDIDVSPDAFGKTAFCKVNVKDAVGNLAIKMWDYEITGEIVTTPDAVSTTPDTVTIPEPEPEPAEEKLDIGPVPEREQVSESKGRKASIVWSVLTSGSYKPGEKVNIEGAVKPEIGKSIPLTINVMAPDDTVYVSQIDTNLSGAFQFDLPLTSGGEWRVIADWQGDSEYEPIKSQALTFQVIPEKTEISKTESTEKVGKAGKFLKKNTMIIGLIFLYVIAIRLYRS